jgi:hypothetical protein
MNCLDCGHILVKVRGAAREHVCDLTGAEVAHGDEGEQRCPLNLVLTSQAERSVTRTILLAASRRGKLKALLSHYPEAERVLLLAQALNVKNDRAVTGQAKPEWLEIAEHLVEMGAYPGMAVRVEA